MATGILALQGSFNNHRKSLDLISREYVLIRENNDLKDIDSLILPGGESTSMIKIQEDEELL